jgi:type VI secretion system secreted protein VgrG
MIFNLTSSAIPPNAKVAGFRGSERLSTPYQFDVWFTISYVPGLPIPFDLAEAIYSKASLTVALGNSLPWTYSGILSSVRLVRAVDGAALFHGRLVPRYWQLSLSRHSRIWTKTTILDVVKEVLDEAGIEYDLRTQETYEVEEQITQYKESDFSFLQRWFDREGLYYFFEQTDDGDILVITDHKGSHSTLRASTVRYFPQSDYNDVMVKQAFDNFTASHNALPASIRLIDYDYAKPLLDVSSALSVDDQATGEVTEYGGRFFSPQDAKRLANIRKEEFLATKNIFEATGATTRLSAGYLYTLDDHPLPQYNADYLVTAIEHHGYDSQFGPAWGSVIQAKYKDVYRVEVTSIEAAVQYRNGQRTAWPRVDGYENAVVDGPTTSQYAQIDDQGRYSLKFKFDEGRFKDGKATTFLRMAQPHGGSQEGFHFPLRKGTEVICSFLGGDPDRPVIVGVVHNMVNQSVVTQSNHTQNVIRSGSLNHIIMEDTKGQMFVDIFTPIFASTLFLGYGEWNFHLRTQGRGRIYTKLDFELDVDGWWVGDVNNYVDWHFHNTHKWVNDLAVSWSFNDTFEWKVTGAVDIDWNATLDLYVKAAATIKMDATLSMEVAANAYFCFGANVTIDICDDLSTTIGGKETHTVTAGRDVTVTGGENVVINGNQTTTINGNQVVHVTGSQTITVDSPEQKSWLSNKFDFTAGLDTSIFIGLKTGIQVGGAIDVFVGNKLGIQVGNQLSLTAGTFLELNASTKIALTSTSVGINGTNVGINGTNIGLNGVDLSFSAAKVKTIGGVDLEMASLEIHL